MDLVMGHYKHNFDNQKMDNYSNSSRNFLLSGAKNNDFKQWDP